MNRIDILQLAEFVLEPEYWVKTAVEFISKNSKLDDEELLNCVKSTIIKSNTTFHDIFEFCLEIYQLNLDFDFDYDFFEMIKNLGNRGYLRQLSYSDYNSFGGVSGKKEGEKLNKILLNFKKEMK